MQDLQNPAAARPVHDPMIPPKQLKPAPATSDEAPPSSGMLSSAPIAVMSFVQIPISRRTRVATPALATVSLWASLSLVQRLMLTYKGCKR